MGTIAQKVQWTWDCKRDIEQALLERGIALPQDFRDFGDAIRSIGRKPYDSEVEYIESTGTQYIDTGIKPDDTTVFSADGLFKYDASATRFGTRDSELNASFTFLTISSGFRSSIGTGSGPTIHGLFATQKNAKTIELDGPSRTGRAVFVDGTTESATSDTAGTAFSCSHNFLLFAFNNGGTVATATDARISACKIVKSGVIVRDFIPVRKNGVGYLYDKVSGKLFGNAGTGAFLYGGDVREVEYIESTGTQYIDTGISMASNSAVPLKVSVDSYGVVSHGIIHNNVDAGTWLGTAGLVLSGVDSLRIYKKDYSSRITKTYTAKRNLHVWDGSTGFSENGTLVESFTADVGSDNITGIHWYLGKNYDIYTSGPVVANPTAFKLYSAQMWLNGVLVRDFIPYRIGNKGCLYDRVSGKFFTNAGTGDFGVGADVLNPTTTSKAVYDAKVEYIESTGTQYIDTGIVPDGKGTSVECVFSNSVDGNFTPVLWTRGTNATDRAYCFELEQHQQARWDYADYGPVQMSNAVPLNEKVTLTIKDGTATVNGVQMARAAKEFTGAGPMILCNFCNYVNGERQMLSVNANPVRIYSFKVFSDGLLVRDFIPVRKDGRGCLCDLVTGRLFENAGTGVFKYGEDVVDLPADTEMIYDSEVEWIAPAGDNTSDSTAWIDAGYVPTTTAHAKAEFSITDIYPEKAYFVFGRQVHNANSRFQIGRSNSVSKPLDIGIGSTYKDFSASSGDFIVELDLSSGTSTVNGVVTTGYVVSASGLGTSGTRVFRREDAGAESSGLRSGVVRLKRLQFSNGSTLIRDFQPVRKNGVGYLYDKVSGKLFGNDGTGAFAYGGDK